MPVPTVEQLKSIAAHAAKTYGIPEALFLALITQESSWRTDAVSSEGARGIAQFMPKTAKSLGINPDDPVEALYGSAKHLADLARHYGYITGGDERSNRQAIQKAAAAYNAGQDRVDKAIEGSRGFLEDNWIVLVPKETQEYLRILNPAISGQVSVGELESPAYLAKKATESLTGAGQSTYTNFSRRARPEDFRYRDENGVWQVNWEDLREAQKAYDADAAAEELERKYNLGPLSQYVEDVMADISNQIATGQLSLTKANSLFQAKLSSYKMATDYYSSDAFKRGAPAGAEYLPGMGPDSQYARETGHGIRAQQNIIVDPLRQALDMFKQAEATIGAVNIPTTPSAAAMRSGFGGPGQYGPPPPDRLADQAADPSYHSEPKDLMEEALRKIREAGGIG